jgi:mRNA interferase MazF
MPEQGEIVLIPVPFTDLSSQKRRPVIVISSTRYNQSSADVVVVAMTSSAAASAYSFTLTSSDLVSGVLNRPGTVRVDKIYTLAQSIIAKRFGKVGRPVVERIRQLLDNVTTP